MRLLIYEYCTAQGIEGNDALASLGFSMLAAVLSDFKELPSLDITTIIHSSNRNLMAQFISDRVHVSWFGEGGETCCDQFERVVADCDAVLVIAPETGGLLAKLIGIAEDKGKIVFGPTAKAAALVSDKGETTKLLAAHGLPVPRSELLSWPLPWQWQDKITDHFSWPLVLKPVTGAGGQGVKVINNLDELERAVKQFEEAVEINACPRPEFRAIQVQEYILGDNVSVSCFVSAGQAMPISLNLQHIAQGKELCFQGITIPYQYPQSVKVLDLAKRACESVEGLGGFVGVDLVLGAQGPVLIEINSRISVAYVALREVAAGNLAHDLWLTCVEKCLPPMPEFMKTYTYRLEG
ncbi:MAG: ATP-grasp domain-containing protein [Desulfosporosinus sp.]|nr:ATP-grasp domain-containing protein [Desulfosporosinus sp.]